MKKDSIKDEASAQIELAQTHNPSVTGRNGTFGIKCLKVWTSIGRCFIDPIGKSGKVLNAGMMIEATDMDRLATVWLRIRGKYSKAKVVKNETKTMYAVVHKDFVKTADVRMMAWSQEHAIRIFEDYNKSTGFKFSEQKNPREWVVKKYQVSLVER